MSKYIDAEKLKAEIERLGRNWDGSQKLQPASFFQADLYELLSIIDDLQQEPPAVDLEKAADTYVGFPYELGEDITSTISRDSFKAGAQWHKEQMMKDAISCEVIGEKRDLRLIDSTERCLFDAKRGDWLKIIIIKDDSHE